MARRRKRKIIQNHRLLQIRLDAMARYLNRDNATDEQKTVARQFEQEAAEHARKADLFEHQTFILVL